MNYLKKDFLTKQNICLLIFIFVNFLFITKYTARHTQYYALIATVVTVFQLLIWLKKEYLLKISKYLTSIDIFLIIAFITVCSILFLKIPVLSLNVDRATVISSFWDNYFANEYVYFAKSHQNNPPGPMPFYYIIALPFYLIGELGYFSLTGIIVFYFVIRLNITPRHYKTTALLLILTSFFYMWEVICRSNILINGTLILISLVYFFTQKKHNSKFIVITGILCGLFISTRNVYVIPYIIAFMFTLRNKQITITQFFYVGCIAVLVFALTFLPFVVNYWNEFLSINPFIVQGDHLMPFKYTLIFIALAFVAPFIARTTMDVYFYSTIVLFVTILGYFIYHIATSGFNETFHGSRADVSYFILCIPFALYYLIKTDSQPKTIIS